MPTKTMKDYFHHDHERQLVEHSCIRELDQRALAARVRVIGLLILGSLLVAVALECNQLFF